MSKKYSSKAKSSKEMDRDESKSNNKGRSNGRRSGNSSKSQRPNKRGSDSVSHDDRRSAFNDLNWYVPNEQVLKDAASINFSHPLGKSLGALAMDGTDFRSTVTIPGIMEIDYVPVFGEMDTNVNAEDGDPSSPINISSRAMYSFVRHANSGHSNYDAQDLTMYIAAMSSLYQWWAYLVRIYGVARLYSFNNKYYPQAVLDAVGLTHGFDAMADLPALRARINTLGLQLSSFAVPTTLPIVSRHVWMCQNIFLDDTGTRAQSYVFRPKKLYQWAEFTKSTSNPKAPRLLIKDVPTLKGSSDWLRQVDNFTHYLLDPILASETMGIMSGDILKAYGASNIYSFAMMDENYTVMPTFAEDIASQIHNMVIVKGTVGNLQQNVKSGLLFQTIDTAFNVGVKAPFIDIRHDDVSPADVMYATRLVNVQTMVEGSRLLLCGSEVVTGVNIYVSVGNNKDFETISFYQTYQLEYSSIGTDGFGVQTSGQSTDALRLLNSTLHAEQFQWGPLSYIGLTYKNDPTNGNAPMSPELEIAHIAGSTDNIIRMDPEVLRRIHACALNGLWGLPFVLTNV